MDIHFDPLGGWSGDMFAAALLDAFPDHWPAVQDAVAALGLGPDAACRLVRHRDHALTGRRFIVAADHASASPPTQAHVHRHDDGEHTSQHDHKREHSHRHRAWADIRQQLADSRLDRATKDHAIAIFSLLAQAEAEVHGVAEDEVAFHEVGAVDSIVDIVVAAQLIALIGADRWTSAPLPLGSGRIRTAHGLLPVPAPATALLLRGLPTIDDGIAGERVTPTGAAIARYLLVPSDHLPARGRILVAAGTGFGSRLLPGISNCLRVLTFSPTALVEVASSRSIISHRELGVITFEVDDQTPEDLSAGLDHLRVLAGVHDVIQSVAFGKKGRVATQVQVLVAPTELDAAIEQCFEETTTIGLRFHIVRGAVLARGFDEVEAGGVRLRVKTVQRPDGTPTGKTEADDVAAQRGHAARRALRQEGETLALARLTVLKEPRP
ncbi:LarC family nickel insertion protein [Lichenihabitans psoromatis]|uniref:LarC family nickel insertion protein n=1 Tax=Lichenihabitans psoromatis TaxID=2528642 RepID=UPI00103840E4|nr:LarC family nickel insertion protein [Lichenihabitans psoromatis]